MAAGFYGVGIRGLTQDQPTPKKKEIEEETRSSSGGVANRQPWRQGLGFNSGAAYRANRGKSVARKQSTSDIIRQCKKP